MTLLPILIWLPSQGGKCEQKTVKGFLFCSNIKHLTQLSSLSSSSPSVQCSLQHYWISSSIACSTILLLTTDFTIGIWLLSASSAQPSSSFIVHWSISLFIDHFTFNTCEYCQYHQHNRHHPDCRQKWAASVTCWRRRRRQRLWSSGNIIDSTFRATEGKNKGLYVWLSGKVTDIIKCMSGNGK